MAYYHQRGTGGETVTWYKAAKRNGAELDEEPNVVPMKRGPRCLHGSGRYFAGLDPRYTLCAFRCGRVFEVKANA
jgi:hypothetical protein